VVGFAKKPRVIRQERFEYGMREKSVGKVRVQTLALALVPLF
jgi:hypothetical protein